MSSLCVTCGGVLPPAGRGRPRTNCLDCSPPKGTPKPAKAKPPAPAATPASAPESLRDAVAAELAAAGREGTVLGLAAISLAERIDVREDSGAGLAAMVKQLAATFADATANTALAGDPLDELRAKRDKKVAGARRPTKKPRSKDA